MLNLTADDISELQEQLEEYKLQREIQVQHSNLLRSSKKLSHAQELEDIDDLRVAQNDTLLYSLHKTTPSQRNKPGSMNASDNRSNDSDEARSTAQVTPNPFFASNRIRD